MLTVDNYILQAFKSGGAFRRTNWVINAFSQTKEEPSDAWTKDPYPYRLVKTRDGVYYVNPADPSHKTLTPIVGPQGEPMKGFGPIVGIKDRLQITQAMVENYIGNEPLDTTYGNLFANYVLLVYPFGSKIPYLKGRFSAKQIESIIIKRLVSDPLDIPVEEMETYAKSDNSKIFVHEYLKFAQGAIYLTVFSQLVIPGDSERSLTTAPDMAEFKKALFEKYKDELHDPAIRAMITQLIVEKDKEWMAGDSSLGLLNVDEGKSFGVVRKKLHGLVGDEQGFETGTDIVPIQNSLREGYDLTRMPSMFDSGRAASFDRGASTALSGVEVKWLRRLGATIGIVQGDCGTKLGRRLKLTNQNKGLFDRFTMINNDGSTSTFDADRAESYLGQNVTFRAAHFCKQIGNNICSTCAGPRLTENPNAVSTYLALVGDVFMALFLKAMHGKSVSTVEYDTDVELY